MNAATLVLMFISGIVLGFVLVAAPWMAVRGPWVKYSVDIERVPTDNDTAELYQQYPMLMFERQQHSNEMCFTKVSTVLWRLVFHLEPRLECHRDRYDDNGGIRIRTYRHRCVVWYCLSKWSVLTNNRTRFSHHVTVSMGHLYNLLVADACWFVWWAPAFLLLFCDCFKSAKCLQVIGWIYIAVAFAARVALSIIGMIEFYRYDGLMDPPHGGYVQNSPLLGKFTTRSYSWGFVCAWIVIGGNGVFILALFFSAIYFCVVGCDKLSSKWTKTRTRVSSIRKTSFRKKGSHRNEPSAPDLEPNYAVPEVEDEGHEEEEPDASDSFQPEADNSST